MGRSTIFDRRWRGERPPSVWHYLGRSNGLGETASEMVGRMTFARITQERMVVPLEPPADPLTVEGFRALVRHPIEEDPNHRTLGVVSEGYGLIDPLVVADLWDRCVGLVPAAVGLLHEDRCFYIAAELARTSSHGDDLTHYLVLVAWTTPNKASELVITPVREASRVTLRLGQSLPVEQLRLVHDAQIRDRLEDWLNGALDRARDAVPTIQQAADLMMATPVRSLPETQDTLKAIMDATLQKLPPRPRETNAPSNTTRDRIERWERDLTTREDLKRAWVAVWQSEGTALRTESTAGTVWGFLQAGAELLNYRETYGGPKNAAEGIMTGRRGDELARAWDACLGVCR